MWRFESMLEISSTTHGSEPGHHVRQLTFGQITSTYNTPRTIQVGGDHVLTALRGASASAWAHSGTFRQEATPRGEQMMNRRSFLSSTAAAAGLLLSSRSLLSAAVRSKLSHKERVDRALSGRMSTGLRTPSITTSNVPPDCLRRRITLSFTAHTDRHRQSHERLQLSAIDNGNWWELKPLDNPYPEQL